MSNLVYLLGPIGCAIIMSAMMWMMMPGNHASMEQPSSGPGPQTPSAPAEIDALRAEVGALRQQTESTSPGPKPRQR